VTILNPSSSIRLELTRRRMLTFSGSAGVALMAAACGGGGGLDPLPGGQQPTTPPQAGAPAGPNIGSGAVRVGLILPLSAGGGIGAAATAIRNAAELAMAEFDNPGLTLLVKDDRGDANTAREVTQQALAEGAELILGPLTAPSVQQASALTRSAGRPMIAFSSDTSVAQPGVYLLSFTPQSDVSRILGYAAGRGKKSVAALLPEGAFGNVIAAEYQQQIARLGLTQGPLQRYVPGRAGEAAKALAGQLSGVDSLLVTDLTAEMAKTADALSAAGIRGVQLLGTGVWNDASVLQKSAVQGGWFAAPDAGGFNSFAERYRKRFNASPTRLATAGYDAVALAAALERTQGSARFTAATLTNPSGFGGQDGLFRFRADGTNERGLAVMQVTNRSAQKVSEPPQRFGAGQS
jgi:ABC-type branched-subunit amino acid transport system substrate-binding protein